MLDEAASGPVKKGRKAAAEKNEKVETKKRTKKEVAAKNDTGGESDGGTPAKRGRGRPKSTKKKSAAKTRSTGKGTVESLTFPKMDRRLTNAQRMKIVETYYKNGNSATATYRALRGDYGLHNRPTTQAIGKIVKKFEETGSVTDIVRPVHHRFACTTDNIAAVSESVAENPNVSIHRRSQELGLSYGTVWRILHRQ